MADHYRREDRGGGGFALTRSRVIAVAACLFGGVIVVNAVALQSEKHPAPMFRSVIRTPEPFPVPPARPEQQATRPAQSVAANVPSVVPPQRPAETRSPEPPPREAAGAKPNMKNELDDLVKRAAGDEKASKTIADIQRALNKAGYGPLSEDGQMGPSTKAALAKFEQDRKLPPRGEPKGPVLRLLASVSGVPIAP